MDKINFTNKDSFPFSTKTASSIQNMILMLQKLTAVGGANYILSGCEVNVTTVNDGYIVIDNEILPFVGGEMTPTISIIEARETATAFGVDYPDAYVNRHVRFTEDGDLNWSEIQRIVSNKELFDSIKAIKGDPPGVRVSWCGLLDRIPENYMLCDGRVLNIADYPELYQNIGTQFGSVGTTQFKLPNMLERFSVCYSDNEDYNTIGKTGGLEKALLTKENLPIHDHLKDPIFNKLSAKASDLTGGAGTTGTSQDSNGATEEYRIGDMSEPLWEKATIQAVGENLPHENRPPYFVEAFIIKVKY